MLNLLRKRRRQLNLKTPLLIKIISLHIKDLLPTPSQLSNLFPPSQKKSLRNISHLSKGVVLPSRLIKCERNSRKVSTFIRRLFCLSNRERYGRHVTCRTLIYSETICKTMPGDNPRTRSDNSNEGVRFMERPLQLLKQYSTKQRPNSFRECVTGLTFQKGYNHITRSIKKYVSPFCFVLGASLKYLVSL